MASLTNEEIGSIVYSMISNIPDGISGVLTTMVNNQIYFSEQFIGVDIGITAVAEVYQPAVISLSASSVMQLMESQGIGTKSVSIGELKITKGMTNGTSTSLNQMGMEQLNAIGAKMSSYQTFT